MLLAPRSLDRLATYFGKNQLPTAPMCLCTFQPMGNSNTNYHITNPSFKKIFREYIHWRFHLLWIHSPAIPSSPVNPFPRRFDSVIFRDYIHWQFHHLPCIYSLAIRFHLPWFHLLWINSPAIRFHLLWIHSPAIRFHHLPWIHSPAIRFHLPWIHSPSIQFHLSWIHSPAIRFHHLPCIYSLAIRFHLPCISFACEYQR